MAFRAQFAVSLLVFISYFSHAEITVPTTPSVTAPVRIVTTIKPIGLIANDIANGLATVDVLLPDNASPHDYALKPSDIKTLRQADMVFWVGSEIEPFLTKLLSKQPNAVPLIRYPGMNVRHVDAIDDNHGHSHAGLDGHIWLGPEQSKVIAKAVAVTLMKKDPKNAAIYQKNLDNFIVEVEKTQLAIQSGLNAQPVKGYVLFHDGYGYFESAFGLKPTGHITVSPERKAGARTLVAIRASLQQQQAQCVFSESQFNPAVIASMTKGTDAKVVMVDPMAKDLNLSQHRYVDFLTALANSYQRCFRD